ncbi:MBL fold metallo-hydrolase [Enterovibrio sp. ZSDZ42]|uniref:MBL fold metallo-hydrolase n=1 Tax=Enterovibrio gelatinilyticus TaxID=2899819 RepID=A0ABT5R160_9GAMM|nr:MBL fold metallo-hydrolase [Enterovibrio sp. ZSDZ42]MDD1794008.1 MBL fold metallo-hydrolase [Enterovibrio sp. ZSDZ42]
MKTAIAFALSFALVTPVMAQSTPLTFDVYYGDDNSFNVTSTVVSGEKEVMVIDTGFTRADALQIASKVLDSGKELNTIYISQADPDYYFGASQLLEIFPHVNVVTTQAVRDAIVKKLETKISFWGPKMGANAPQQPRVPDVFKGKELKIDDTVIQIKGTDGVLAHRPYLWIPSEKAILGNVGIVEGMHVWMADTQTEEEVTAWLEQLHEMQSLKSELVIPGHMKTKGKLDPSTIEYTATWIERFADAKAKSKDSKGVIDTMVGFYPELGATFTLELGAQVHEGEVQW